MWLAANPSKRWTEVFFLAYSPFWILWALCILVPFQLYEVSCCRCCRGPEESESAGSNCETAQQKVGSNADSHKCMSITHGMPMCCVLCAVQYCNEWGYLMIGLAACVPCWVLPLVLPNKVGSSGGSGSWLLGQPGEEEKRGARPLTGDRLTD